MNFPSINEVEGIVKLIKKTKPELIIAAGGGSNRFGQSIK